MQEQSTEKGRMIWRDIYENVQKGESFQLLWNCTKEYSPLLISMVAAGESSGSLDVIMRECLTITQRKVS